MHISILIACNWVSSLTSNRRRQDSGLYAMRRYEHDNTGGNWARRDRRARSVLVLACSRRNSKIAAVLSSPYQRPAEPRLAMYKPISLGLFCWYFPYLSCISCLAGRRVAQLRLPFSQLRRIRLPCLVLPGRRVFKFRHP
jgi:hypothetical protein